MIDFHEIGTPVVQIQFDSGLEAFKLFLVAGSQFVRNEHQVPAALLRQHPHRIHESTPLIGSYTVDIRTVEIAVADGHGGIGHVDHYGILNRHVLEDRSHQDHSLNLLLAEDLDVFGLLLGIRARIIYKA